MIPWKISVVEWGPEWMVTFNIIKIKIPSISNYKKPFQPQIVMVNSTFAESEMFKVLGLTFSGDIKWNKYIEDTVKSAVNVGTFYQAGKLFAPVSMLYLYKATIRL